MHNEWVPPKSTSTPPTPPALPRPVAPSAEEIRSRLDEAEAEVERATLAMVRLWSKLHDMNKEA